MEGGAGTQADPTLLRTASVMDSSGPVLLPGADFSIIRSPCESQASCLVDLPFTCHSSQASPCKDCHLWNLEALTRDFGSSDHLKATGARHLTSHLSIMTRTAGVGGGLPLYRRNREAGPRPCPASPLWPRQAPFLELGTWRGPQDAFPPRLAPLQERGCAPLLSPPVPLLLSLPP